MASFQKDQCVGLAITLQLDWFITDHSKLCMLLALALLIYTWHGTRGAIAYYVITCNVHSCGYSISQHYTLLTQCCLQQVVQHAKGFALLGHRNGYGWSSHGRITFCRLATQNHQILLAQTYVDAGCTCNQSIYELACLSAHGICHTQIAMLYMHMHIAPN